MALTSRDPSTPVLNATRARQGRFGRHVFWVLLVSTILAALGMFIAWGFKADNLAATENDNKPTRAEAGSFNAPEPAPVVVQQPEAAPPQ